MTETEIKKIVGEQRSYFHTGATLPVSVRVHALNKLKSCIIEKEEKINKAIHQDLGKSAFETYMCETGLVLSELSYMLKHISSCPVSFEKLQETVTLWRYPHYESVELSVSSDH